MKVEEMIKWLKILGILIDKLVLDGFGGEGV